MRPFRRHRGRYTATFEAGEVAVLSDLLDQVRHLLAQRRAQAAGTADPLAVMTGMVTGPSDAPDDPALARLLPDFHRDDPVLSAGLRVLREPGIVAGKDAAAVAVLDSLPRGGGTVHLSAELAESWIAALNDIRLSMGVRLGITEDDREPPGVGDDPDGPAAAAYHVYRWLSAVQDSLVGVMLA
ncbi:DUF2017 domain-containing protein [Nakamurella endophytica]|uniref:DUF2017 domain-containing protein n=1 Tax=Nakamurella endophytica TaxID=1748367 RepID=A0A917T3S6_9ACTN|nr:DUF2017 domain-containing protein [Nakamurella endophytica]GGM07283.1 hypothetical protein GCM10011594_29130 [Nakamurella endophytica]